MAEGSAQCWYTSAFTEELQWTLEPLSTSYDNRLEDCELGPHEDSPLIELDEWVHLLDTDWQLASDQQTGPRGPLITCLPQRSACHVQSLGEAMLSCCNAYCVLNVHCLKTG